MTTREEPWDDADLLEELYWRREMSCYEIGDELGCSHTTVRTRMEDNDIPRRSHSELSGRLHPKFNEHASFYMDGEGYEKWASFEDGNHKEVRLHRLLAVSEYGLDAVVDNHIHHKNNIPWDNRPENIVPISPSEHIRLHKTKDD